MKTEFRVRVLGPSTRFYRVLRNSGWKHYMQHCLRHDDEGCKSVVLFDEGIVPQSVQWRILEKPLWRPTYANAQQI